MCYVSPTQKLFVLELGSRYPQLVKEEVAEWSGEAPPADFTERYDAAYTAITAYVATLSSKERQAKISLLLDGRKYKGYATDGFPACFVTSIPRSQSLTQ